MDTWTPLPDSPEKEPHCSAAQTARGGSRGARTPAGNCKQEGGGHQVPSVGTLLPSTKHALSRLQ